MMHIATTSDFQAHVAAIETKPGYQRPVAWGLGIATLSHRPGANGSRKILDTWFPVVNHHENTGSAAVLCALAGLPGHGTAMLTLDQLDEALATFTPFLKDGKVHANIDALRALRDALENERLIAGMVVPQHVVVVAIADLAHKPLDAHDAYLRLHLLSHRKVKPHGQNLEGIFGLLANVVWTDHGPFDPEHFDHARLAARARGVSLKVSSVDKFPRMTDYVIPSGVRIADADRVRLGAHLSEGTTVMHEGFCNFNAGTLGKSMVEGRISAGVVVGDGSDIGGGASIMGTLSGGGKEVIRIGERCLLGANAGLGISLGDSCTVESGLYLTSSSKVALLPERTVVKAWELSGRSDLLFRRNSLTGAIEATNKQGAGWSGLNVALHSNA